MIPTTKLRIHCGVIKVTNVEHYFKLKQEWGKAKNQEEYDSLGDKVVSFRDEHFTKSDWEELISQSTGRAKYEYTKRMNELFPEG